MINDVLQILQNWAFYVPYVIYLCILMGLCLIVYRPIIDLLYITKKDFQILQYNQSRKSNQGMLNRIREHITLLLKVSFNMQHKNAAKIFIMLSWILSVTMLLLIKNISPTLSIFAAVGAFLAPYIVLRVRLQKKRLDSSYEADILIPELINAYKINHYNMEEALDKVSMTLEGAPNTKPLLINLSKKLKTSTHPDDVDAALLEFNYSISTTWSNMLALNIRFAVIDGIKIDNGLYDVLENVNKARKLIEESKRENNESSIMLKFFAPAVYIFFIILAVNSLGFTINKYIENQFYTSEGMQLFIIIVMLYLICIILSIIWQRKKMDF